MDNKTKTLKLKKPITFNEKDLSSLTFDFEGLTGFSMLQAEKDARIILKEPMRPIQGTSVYALMVASKACKVPYFVLQSVSAQDFIAIVGETNDFFNQADWEEGELPIGTSPEANPTED